MSKIGVVLGIVGILVVALASVASAAPPAATLAQFAGDWNNVAPNSAGITKVSIQVSGAAVTLHAWGKCTPTDCDWGAVAATPYAATVSSNVVQSALALTAMVDAGFSETLLVVHLPANLLQIESFTHFKDNSGRTDYSLVNNFAKASSAGLPAPGQVSPPNGIPFDNYPRTTTLAWQTVPGAASYTAEVDCYECCEVGKWCTDVGRTYIKAEGLTTNTYTFEFAGAQAGRWRVWAVDAAGQAGANSGWWIFTYTK